ncbi:hypothetical protein BDN72DRAFT_906211 [Pluteus cervinus]|uniref:Uncharacterized protein n=1 Tax=Pluteus cervinus TaxID=181527 RepID=A0ACD3A062_9AGAR|nr:hypothetical protein BDN72DRAFT_906211 [Pluteus cervinus]
MATPNKNKKNNSTPATTGRRTSPRNGKATSRASPYPSQSNQPAEDPGQSTSPANRRRPPRPQLDFNIELSGPLRSPRPSVTPFPSEVSSEIDLPIHITPIRLPPVLNFAQGADISYQSDALKDWAKLVVGRHDTEALAEVIPNFLDGMTALLSEVNHLRNELDYHFVEEAIIERETECRLCRGPLTEPVTTPCGHTYCAHCLHKNLTASIKQNTRELTGQAVGASPWLEAGLLVLPFESYEQFERYRLAWTRLYGKERAAKLTSYSCPGCYTKMTMKPRFFRALDSVVAVFTKQSPAPINARPVDNFIPLFPL